MTSKSSKVHTFTLQNLPKSIVKKFSTTRILGNQEKYTQDLDYNDDMSVGLFAMVEDNTPNLTAEVVEHPVIWATGNYAEVGDNYNFFDPVQDFSVIIPRSEKSKTIQKLRTKEKAEVFTPSWVCNRQNNLIDSSGDPNHSSILLQASNKPSIEELSTLLPTDKDDNSSAPSSRFNSESTRGVWHPSVGTAFPDTTEGHRESAEYILRKVLEITCGEAPYLVSPYDTVTGEPIPVRDKDGLYTRIGLLDRKLRVVTESAEQDEKAWFTLAVESYKSTYGYEWQGDNLMLARLNLLNTFIEYFVDTFDKSPTTKMLNEIADIISWNLWQMDGLKMVLPLSCSKDCVSCAKKLRTGHNGRLALVRFDNNVIPFEKLLRK